jgi:hypothetical protein
MDRLDGGNPAGDRWRRRAVSLGRLALGDRGGVRCADDHHGRRRAASPPLTHPQPLPIRSRSHPVVSARQTDQRDRKRTRDVSVLMMLKGGIGTGTTGRHHDQTRVLRQASEHPCHTVPEKPAGAAEQQDTDDTHEQTAAATASGDVHTPLLESAATPLPPGSLLRIITRYDDMWLAARDIDHLLFRRAYWRPTRCAECGGCRIRRSAGVADSHTSLLPVAVLAHTAPLPARTVSRNPRVPMSDTQQ